MASGSVLKGSAVLIFGRTAGMAGSFLLFLFLTWRSKEAAGAFRIALTYLALMDFLPLLGMHRWVASEIAHRKEQQFALFELSCLFAIGVALSCGGVYVIIASVRVYGADASGCLEIVALTAAGSAINLCSLSALIGLGQSHVAGYLSLLETVARSALSILLIYMGAPIIWIVLVFAVTRYSTAAAGYGLVRAQVSRTSRRIDRTLVAAFLSQAPNLALSTVGFLAMRNAAVLLLPIFQGDAAAAVYSAAFQLIDLALLAPTMLMVSANHILAESARESPASLRRNTRELITISAAFFLPVATLGIALAGPIVTTLFGADYRAAAPALRILLVGACVLSLDQVLALAMTVSGRYRADRLCMTIGPAASVIATCLLSRPWSVTGAATGFFIGAGVTVAIRLSLMRWLLRPRLVAAAVRPPAVAAICVGLFVAVIAEWAGGDRGLSTLNAVLLTGFGTGLYCVILYERGGLRGRRLARAVAFMAKGR
jgi:O-antigen/teichoic acid export membrane protein